MRAGAHQCLEPGLSKAKEIVFYYAHDRAVRNAVVDDIQSQGFRARLIEGGNAAWKEACGETVPKSQGYPG